MAKCDVCEKTTILPERFGDVNICKICFMKANGPFWKRQYDRYEDLQKQRSKVMETATKYQYSDDVVEALDNFFITQVDAMTECDGCGELVRAVTPVGQAYMCDKCFSKIHTSAWKENNYEDNEEVEKNRKKVLKIATKQGYPQVVVDGINAHFNSRLQPGLICIVDGGVGQKLRVFETHCILVTDNDFDVEEMSKRYGKALKKSRPSKGSSFGANAAKALAAGVLFPGGSLLGTGARVAASAAITTAADKYISGKGTFRVVKGGYRIDYHTYGFADFAQCGDRDDDVGFIRFARNGGDAMDDIVFLFDENYSKIQSAYHSICKGIERARDPQAVVQEVNVAIQNNVHNTQNNFAAQSTPQSLPPVSVADELLKFKQLLDMGAITQEEFDKKKKELLNK